MPNGVEFEGRLAHVGTFPIGIEPASFINARHIPSLLRSPLTNYISNRIYKDNLSKIAYHSLNNVLEA